MGIGYTIDTPIRVAAYGINSVVSVMDDIFIEKMRAVISQKFDKTFVPVDPDDNECRSKRITAYLDLLNDIVHERFDALKNAPFEKGSDITTCFELLPDSSYVKQQYLKMLTTTLPEERMLLQKWLKKQLSPGMIDVNIMSKVDKVNYKKGKALPREFNDAHAALRGYALSKLESSVVFSAGLNPGLMDYTGEFDDFFPNAKGRISKKIILKVSDFRSASIQGKYLAKKGLWVSEYRVESGLNCGGHAFATDGFLMGPILEEFKTKREELVGETYEWYIRALTEKGRVVPGTPPCVKFSAQGGVGTAAEHRFLRDYYRLNSVGWGSPFLLVPEATSLDGETLELLRKAEEKDLYLSNISPLGITFNNLRGNTKDLEKEERIRNNKPGSPCTQHYLVSNTTYTKKPVCTASRKYQSLAIKALKEEMLGEDEYQKKYEKITEKSCICVGLSTSALIANELDTSLGGKGVSICPGPNLAYFSRIVSLREMIDHIYGRKNVISRTDRPNMFIKELEMYVSYLRQKISEFPVPSEKQQHFVKTFQKNLEEGISYYNRLFSTIKTYINDHATEITNDLKRLELELSQLKLPAKS